MSFVSGFRWVLAQNQDVRLIPTMHDSRLVACSLLGDGEATVANAPTSQIRKRDGKIDRFAAVTLNVAQPLTDITRRFDAERTGVYIGNMLGGWTFGEHELRTLHTEGAARVSAFQATAWFPAAAQGELCVAFGLKGHSKTFSGDLCCGLEALVAADDAISMGRADCILVGAAESLRSSMAASGVDGLSSNVGEACCFLALTRQPLDQSLFLSISTCCQSEEVAGLQMEVQGKISDLCSLAPFYLGAHPLIEVARHAQRAGQTLRDLSMEFRCRRRRFNIALTHIASENGQLLISIQERSSSSGKGVSADAILTS